MALRDKYGFPSKRVALTTGDPEPKPVPAGRVSIDSLSNLRFNNGWTMVAPKDHLTNWRLEDLDTAHLDRYTPKELLDMLADISPEISAAIWHFQRMCNPGYECKSYELGSEDVESVEGKAHIDSVFHNLREQYGSADIVIGRFSMGAFMRGAVCGELVLDSEARETIDLVSPDPYSIRFRKKEDPLRKEVWQPGQWQGREFVPLDIPTFKYLPIDPAPASPYGRSLATPALFAAIFSLSLLHDVKRVIMQQGYKRIDISMDTEMAMDSFSYDQQGHVTLNSYIKAAFAQIEDVYRHLQPDDALFHTDLFTVNAPVGTIDLDGIKAIDSIMIRLEKKLVRALKSNGVVMDTSEQTNEADSNRKWEIYIAGIKSIQHHVENMLESLLTLSLRAKGIQARVVFRFSEVRASEMLRDEQTRQLRIQNSVAEYKAGFVSQDEASNNAVNHDADVPEPRSDVALEMVGDNNSGNEALDKNQDDRKVKVHLNGHSKETVALN